MAVFRWTDKAKQAAELVAAGEFTYSKIAEEVGVARQTIHEWLGKPEFRQRVEDHAAGFRAQVRSMGIAVLEKRVEALNDRWYRMKQVIEDRALAYADDTHGGATGLVCRKVKWERKWNREQEEYESVPVYEYEVDTGLLKELREHEKQAAQELGQWTEKQQVNGTGDININVTNLKAVILNALAGPEHTEARVALARKLKELSGAGEGGP